MKNKFEGYVIYSDLDGTLLNNKKEVSDENKKAINFSMKCYLLLAHIVIHIAYGLGFWAGIFRFLNVNFD